MTPRCRRRRPLHLQPRAAGRLRRLRRPRRRRGGRQRDHRGGRRRGRRAASPTGRAGGCCGNWPASPACTCRRCTRSTYDGERIAEVRPRYPDVPERVEKRTIADLAAWPYPKHQLVPLTEVVHDRLNVEVFRGCTRGCRFCQAGMITRPVRERPAEQVRSMIADGLRRTGYDEVALTSLSTADFSGHRGGRALDRRRRLAVRRAHDGVAAEPAGRRLHRRHRRRASRGPGAPGSPSLPRRAPGGSARSSTS